MWSGEWRLRSISIICKLTEWLMQSESCPIHKCRTVRQTPPQRSWVQIFSFTVDVVASETCLPWKTKIEKLPAAILRSTDKMHLRQFLGYSSILPVMPLNPARNHLSSRIKIIPVFYISVICLWVTGSTDTRFKTDFKNKVALRFHTNPRLSKTSCYFSGAKPQFSYLFQSDYLNPFG